MSVSIRIPAPLRSITAGESIVSVGGESVDQVLNELESRFPAIRHHQHDLGRHVAALDRLKQREQVRAATGDQDRDPRKPAIPSLTPASPRGRGA